MFVFSLEDEISFQTVYNYFLRLCSFRNASEVPMVLVGTQGERARWAVLAGGGGMEVRGARGESPLLLSLGSEPLLCRLRAGTTSLLPACWTLPSWGLPPV